jgi:tetratricopeptide (TPR) repeat protein
VAQQIIQRPVDPPPPTQAALAARKEAGLKLVFNQAIETLLSPQASYDQKKAVWKQLKATGKLDEAVAELEQRVASDPNSADAATALGEGYYKEAGQTDDVREKAMLAMKADQTLEAALNLDPSSWDARFTKTVGMSYWPPELNKGQEVIDQFQALIQQQEGGPPQPRFADSYLRLGDQYQKAGNPDSANQVWQRGAALFPDNEELRGKLAPAPQPAP